MVLFVNISIILLLCIFVFCISWFIKSELLDTMYLIGNMSDADKNMSQTLENLLSENKIISAKEFFGYYITYYNNFVLILTGIIGVFGVSSFVYFKNKHEDIEHKTVEEIKKKLEETGIKKIIKDVVLESIQNAYEEEKSTIDKEIENIKKRLETLEDETNSIFRIDGK